MAARRPSNPNALWNVLLLLLAGSGGLALMSGELSSTRPNVTRSWMSQPPGDVCVEARLWQDPIEAAERHIAETGGEPEPASADPDGPDSGKSPLLSDETAERKSGTGAGDTGVATVIKHHRGGDHTGAALEWWLQRRLCAASKSRHKVLVLGVHTRGGAWPENREFRLRTRYAIVTALTSLGYNADDSQRIGVVDIPNWPCGAQSARSGSSIESVTCTGRGECRAIVPYERFTLLDEYKGSKLHEFSAIAVIWLSDDYFDDPLYAKFAHLLCTLDHLPPPPNSENDGIECKPGRLLSALGDQLELKLIGPTGSNGLIDMYVEENRLLAGRTLSLPGFDCPALRVAMTIPPALSKMLEHLEVWVPWATMSKPLVEWYASQRTGDRCVRRLDKPDGRRCACGPRYQRVTGTDDVLAHALVQELELRGVGFSTTESSDPFKEPDNSENSDKATPPGASSVSVVILTEADTSYGRTFPMQFAAAIKNHEVAELQRRVAASQRGADPTDQPPLCRKQLEEMVTGGTWPPELGVYRYLRGADGIVPSDDGTKASYDAGDNATTQQDVTANGAYSTRKKRRKPIGPAQYDYVRRLASRLKRDYDGLKAIGVCGTDVYDKLVLLRALRDEFPQLLMFTTDLYSRLEHGDNLPATHNLIIASHHGLQPDVQYLTHRGGGGYWKSWTSLQDPTPMRDTYQAATFEACVGAVTRIAPPPDHLHRAYLYEIGRHGAYLLNDTSGRRILGWKLSWGATAAAFSVVGVLALLLVPFLPTTWMGVSKVWHIVVVLLCLLPVMILLAFAWKSHFDAHGEPFVLGDGLSVWPSNFIRTLAGMTAVTLLVYGQVSLQGNLRTITNRFGSSPAGVLQPIAGTSKWHTRNYTSVWVLDTDHLYRTLRRRLSQLFGKWFPKSRRLVALLFQATNLDTRYTKAYCEKRSICEFLKLYGAEETQASRFARIGVVTLLYMVLMTVLCLLFFSDVSFRTLVRGSSTFAVSLVILLLGVYLMLYLLFYTVDATRRCQQFINSLASYEEVDPPNTANDRAMTSPWQTNFEWKLIEIIGSRTREVNRLIIFATAVIILMVVSRTSYIDNWGMPVPLLIIVGLNFVYAVLCAISLRCSATAARRAAIARLTATVARLSPPQPLEAPGREADEHAKRPSREVLEHRKEERELIRNTITRIQEYEEGAFGPWTQQPVLRAILYPSGGFGAAALIQYLMGS